jgi:hypothetical protein
VAAGIATVASFGFASDQDNPPRTEQTVAMAAMTEVQDTPVKAEVGLTQIAGGTEVSVHCTYASEKGHGESVWPYRLVAVSEDGTKDQVGSWMAGSGSDVTLSGVTHFAYHDIGRLELQKNSGDPILVYHVR